jgi:tRNA nucleotidyltransferase (CCA-adding enzyme)
MVNKASLETLFGRILKDIVPTKSEIDDLNEYSNELMGRLKAVMPKDVEIILAGSVARGTQIRGKSDIDIFLLFPKYLEERKMEEDAIKLAKKAVLKSRGESYEINYAEHPYLKLKNEKRGIYADIVPAFKIRDSSERGSSVDRTQLHNIFVLENLNDRQKDEVRILKYLLQRHNIYGAESSRHAFSGYLCELLMAHYKSMLALLEGISSSKLPLFIDVKANIELSGASVPKEEQRRFNSPLIVIDPTDQNRNVAASVSSESISRLMLLARNLLSNPSESAFYGFKYSDDKKASQLSKFIKASGLQLDALCFKLSSISEDTLWPQLEKLKNRIEHEADTNGLNITISFSRIESGMGTIAILHNMQKLGIRRIMGPDVTIRVAADEFIRKHGGQMKISVDGTRLVALEKPKYIDVNDMLSKIISDKKFLFTKDIKKSQCKLYSKDIPVQYALVVYHGIAEKLNI